MVTGCAGGLGLAIVDALASHGARILASEVHAGEVDRAARVWRERGYMVEKAVADHSREDEVSYLAQRCLEGAMPPTSWCTTPESKGPSALWARPPPPTGRP